MHRVKERKKGRRGQNAPKGMLAGPASGWCHCPVLLRSMRRLRHGLRMQIGGGRGEQHVVASVLQLVVVRVPVQLLPRIIIADLVLFLEFRLAFFLCLLLLALLAMVSFCSQCFAPRLCNGAVCANRGDLLVGELLKVWLAVVRCLAEGRPGVLLPQQDVGLCV